MKLKVQTLDAKAKGDIDLNDDVFGIEPRADILHRVVTWQREKARGTARPTRERSDVARTGKKFGNQKGGGTARHGNRRRGAPGDAAADRGRAARRDEQSSLIVCLNHSRLAVSHGLGSGVVLTGNLFNRHACLLR